MSVEPPVPALVDDFLMRQSLCLRTGAHVELIALAETQTFFPDHQLLPYVQTEPLKSSF